MLDIENLSVYQVERPNRRTVFGDPDDFDHFPATHKDQIIFLDKQADKFLHDYLKWAKLVANNDDPFNKNNFKTVEHYTEMADENKLKKWLYNRAIPFKTNVFLLGDDAIFSSWKMIVKYSPRIFFFNDIAVFDKTLNWCLFYFHHDHLFFGRDNIYDSTNDHVMMDELNKLKKQHPNMNFPY